MKELLNGSFSKTRELIRNVNRAEVKSHRQKVTRNRGNRTVVITVSTKDTKQKRNKDDSSCSLRKMSFSNFPQEPSVFAGLNRVLREREKDSFIFLYFFVEVARLCVASRSLGANQPLCPTWPAIEECRPADLQSLLVVKIFDISQTQTALSAASGRVNHCLMTDDGRIICCKRTGLDVF